MKFAALVNEHDCVTCENGAYIFKEINDLQNHFNNQDDWCHTMFYNFLHEPYDGDNVKKAKNKKNKQGKKANKA